MMGVRVKVFKAIGLGLLVSLGITPVLGEAEGNDPTAQITQDSIRLDLDTGNLFFNGDSIALEELIKRLPFSNSIALDASSFSGESPVVSTAGLYAVLDQMEQVGMDPTLVRLNLFHPVVLKRNKHHLIEFEQSGSLLLNGKEITIAELAASNRPEASYVITTVPKSVTVNYPHVLSVLRALGNDASLAGLGFVDQDQVEVELLIYQLNADGSRDVLSAPKVSTKPGNLAMVRVVENASGRKTYPLGSDEYYQEDLANLGIRLSAKPQIIGDHVRVSGAAILTKLEDRVGIFLDESIPIASYSCKKVVIPFCVVFPPGTDTVNFRAAEVEGRETMCQLKARVVDHRGMSRADRERVRTMRNPSSDVSITVHGQEAEK